MDPLRLSSTIPVRFSLLRRFRLLNAVVVLGAALSVAAMVIQFVSRSEQQAWLSRQHDVSFNAARVVQAFLERAQSDLVLIASLDATYLETFPEQLQALLTQNPSLLEVIRVDSQAHLLAQASQVETPVLDLLFTSAQANWFQTAQRGEQYIGSLQIAAQNEPYLILSVPAQDGGVVAGRLSMNLLWEVVGESQFGRSGLVYVVDTSNGQIIAHPDAQVVLGYTQIADRPEFDVALHTTGHEWNGRYKNYAGQAVLGGSLPIQGANWLVFAEVSQSEATSAARNALVFLGSGVLLVGALVGLLMDIFLRSLVLAPIEQLRSGAVRVGTGELDFRVQTLHHDELGQVALAFNTMTEQIRDREAALAQARDNALATNQLLQIEREKSERLLRSILPDEFADILKDDPRTVAYSYDQASVLFADVVDFTHLALTLPPDRLISLLNHVFLYFDGLAAKYGIEKIKTIGDCYMAAGGVLKSQPDHTLALGRMALEARQHFRKNTFNNHLLRVRIGISTGPVVAGVIWQDKILYDLWGDTVNTASRMQTLSLPNRIQVNEPFYELTQERFVYEKRGVVQVKGKGRMRLYFLESEQPR